MIDCDLPWKHWKSIDINVRYSNAIHMRHLLKIIPLLFLMACGHSSSDSAYYENADVDDEVEENGYEDGVYCAEVEYYYSVTGTRSTYTLEIEVESEELTVIRWPNGGWLDNSHFSPPDISDGYASFTSDRNVEYKVTIIGEEGECSTDHYAKSEVDLVDEGEAYQDEEESEYSE